MSSEYQLSQIAAFTTNTNPRTESVLKSDSGIHPISEDSGSCDQLATPVSTSPIDEIIEANKPDNAQQTVPENTKRDDDTLYSDSFESSSNQNFKTESSEDEIEDAKTKPTDQQNITTFQQEVTANTNKENKETIPAVKKPITTTNAHKQSSCEVVLRADSLKKISLTKSSEVNVLFKNTRFKRSKSSSFLIYSTPHTLLNKSHSHLSHSDLAKASCRGQVVQKAPPPSTSTPTNLKPAKSHNESEPVIIPEEDSKLSESVGANEINPVVNDRVKTASEKPPRASTARVKTATKKEHLQAVSASTVQDDSVKKAQNSDKLDESKLINTEELAKSNNRDGSMSKIVLRPLQSKLKNSSRPPFTHSNSFNIPDQTQRSSESKKSSILPTKTTITVDTSKARSNAEVVKECLKELDWQDCPQGLPNQICDIMWLSVNQESESICNSIQPQQTNINKFPCMNTVLKKGPLTRALNVMRQIYPEEYSFYPRTWFLPEELREFHTESRYMHEKQVKSKQVLSTFILKPNDGSQGEGIYLIKDPEEYMKLLSKRNRSRPYIVQEYIHNPFLIDGLKSDLRLYVVVVSVKPLEIYLCDEGLVRFATINYQFPDESNYRSSFMHLTNYSINKKNEDYKFYDRELGAIKLNGPTAEGTNNTPNSSISVDASSSSAGEGSKRKLSTVFAYMQSKGYNVGKIRGQIDDLVAKTVLALLPEIQVNCAFETLKMSNRHKTCYFQILGFDILLTDKLKPVLLEVNCNPSLRIDYEMETENGKVFIPSSIDIDIKKPLVLETLKLVAPKRKLDIIEQCKRKEEQIEKANKYRNCLVQQRLVERNQQKLTEKKKKFDYSKCPLLSKPGEQYIKKLNKMTSPRSLTLFNEFNHLRSTSTGLLYSATSTSIAMSKRSDTLKLSENNLATSNTERGTERKRCLRSIYPKTRIQDQYEKFFILEAIADIFVSFTLENGVKLMSHADFRSFVKKCNLVNENTSSDNLDIIFFDLSKKWQLYNRKKNTEDIGLCYQAFLQFFLTFSQLNFDEKHLEQNLKLMINFCQMSMKPVESKIVITPDNDINDDIGTEFNIKEQERERPKTCGSGMGSAGSSMSGRVTKPLFTTTEKYTLGSTNTYSRVPDFKSVMMKTSKAKKSLFPIFFDSSSRA